MIASIWGSWLKPKSAFWHCVYAKDSACDDGSSAFKLVAELFPVHHNPCNTHGGNRRCQINFARAKTKPSTQVSLRQTDCLRYLRSFRLTSKFTLFQQPVSHGDEHAAVRMSCQGVFASGHARPTVAAPLSLATTGAATVRQTMCNSSRRPTARTSFCHSNPNPGPSQKSKGIVANLLLHPSIQCSRCVAASSGVRSLP